MNVKSGDDLNLAAISQQISHIDPRNDHTYCSTNHANKWHNLCGQSACTGGRTEQIYTPYYDFTLIKLPRNVIIYHCRQGASIIGREPTKNNPRKQQKMALKQKEITFRKLQTGRVGSSQLPTR